MARISRSKASLSREQGKLKTYRQFLPSLDLKRRQLIAERARAAREVAALERLVDRLRADTARALPMLANRDVDLSGLVRVAGVQLDQQNVVGTRLPVVRAVDTVVRPYSPLAKPHWVDAAVEQLRAILEQIVRLRVARRRLELFDAAVKKITQRVNLFEKVLIPRAEADIKSIQIFLSDAEREGVIRAKLAKMKTAARAATEQAAEL